MSRYVAVELQVRSLDEIAAGLATLGLAFMRPKQRVMLEGSLECAGEPVDVRLEPGTLGSVEDFGFVREGDDVRLVCGEVDASLLKAELVGPLTTAVVQARLKAEGITVDRVEVGADGIRRVIVTED